MYIQPDFATRKARYISLAAFFVCTYLARGVIFCLLGHLQEVVSYFVKFEVFFIISTAAEVPFIFYQYAMHIITFWDTDVQTIVNNKISVLHQEVGESDHSTPTDVGGSGSSTKPKVIMVMALMDIDFAE